MYVVGLRKRQPCAAARSCVKLPERLECLDKKRIFAKRQKTQAISKEPLVIQTPCYAIARQE
jgi:hypothetical protein